jgi:peptidoglycan/xylan/chitin deacetylase (PgdA/CDA1 family)
MSSFTYIFFVSYLIGLISPKYLAKEHKILLDFLKGFLAAVLAGLYINIGLAFLVATLGVTLGHKWPVTEKLKFRESNNENNGEVVVLGALSRSSPLFALLALLFFLMLNKKIKNYAVSVLITSTVLVIAMIVLRKPDSLILTGIFIFFISLFQLIAFIENTDEENLNFLNRHIFYKTLSTLGIICLILLLFFNRYVYKGFGMQIDIIRHGPRELKYVALTFDDGPSPLYTPQILDVLKEKDVKATFFLIGKNALQYPSIVKRIEEEGHSIGSHTYSHRSLIPLSRIGTYNEIVKAEKAIQHITGEKPTLFRPPRGVYSQYARKLLKELRYTLVLWDVSSQDWKEIKYTDIAKVVLNRVRPGSIVLFHDSGDIIKAFGGNRSHTVRALPIIIDELRARGYEFITVDEMLILKGLSETEENPLDDHIDSSEDYLNEGYDFDEDYQMQN